MKHTRKLRGIIGAAVAAMLAFSMFAAMPVAALGAEAPAFFQLEELELLAGDGIEINVDGGTFYIESAEDEHSFLERREINCCDNMRIVVRRDPVVNQWGTIVGWFECRVCANCGSMWPW